MSNIEEKTIKVLECPEVELSEYANIITLGELIGIRNYIAINCDMLYNIIKDLKTAKNINEDERTNGLRIIAKRSINLEYRVELVDKILKDRFDYEVAK